MGIASKYNKGSKFDFTLPEDAPYKKVKDLTIGETVIIRSLFISTKSKYGDAPVALTDSYYINLPSHLTDTVKDMLQDDDFIAAVKRGEVGVTPYTYEKDGNDLYSVNWVDVVPTVSAEAPAK